MSVQRRSAMKKAMLSSLPMVAWTMVAMASSPTADSSKNHPVVHSFDGGRHFVRSIPTEDYDSSGKTEVYRVTRDGDELIGEYDVYMYGDLFFSWCPDQSTWGIVQLEPVRVIDPNAADKLGDVFRLAFYLAGKKTIEYSQEDLAKMGLKKSTDTLVSEGDFIVQGITKYYQSPNGFFSVKTRSEDATSEVVVAFDACTGELLDAEQVEALKP